MKRLVAYNAVNKCKVALSMNKTTPLVEHISTNERHTHVITHSHHDSHTHPILYSLFFGALNPVMLNETTDKQEILRKLRARAKETDAPIVAYEYKLTAELTSKDLEEFNGYVLLVDSSMHSGVANAKLLLEVMKRKSREMIGSCDHEGISEDFQFLALGIMEEQVKDKGVEEAVKWVRQRIKQGTTSMDEKIILTDTEWEIFKVAAKRIEHEAGFQPIRSVYVRNDLFVKNPERYVLEGESLGIRVGVKWVGDGGLGSKTAALGDGTYVDGTRGHLTIPINHQNFQAVEDYINMLRDHGITDLAVHAIGDKTIGIVLDMVSRFNRAGITVSIEHFELPTQRQIYEAARMQVPLNMQLNYSTEVWRYAQWAGRLVDRINPVKRILDSYSNHSRNGKLPIRFGTDGMPQSMLWAIACGVNHPIKEQRITLEQAIEHSKDTNGVILLKRGVYDSLPKLDLRGAAVNREASSALLDSGVDMVIRKLPVGYSVSVNV